jgi:serine/threonine protein kinase
MSYSLEKEHIYLSTVGRTHRFTVHEMIDCGTFGKVYEAEDSKFKKKVAVKVEPTSLKACQLIHECNIYRGLIL